MFELKQYQKRALTTLENFLVNAKQDSVGTAFEQALIAQNQTPVAYRHYQFGEIPYICLRLPTGGGKTVLASHSVKVAKLAYLEQDFPIVLWLVPTNTIREQTLSALTTVNHPYRQALEQEFGLDRLRILDIGKVHDIRPQDIGRKAIIVVGTLASLRVEDTSGRAVYAYHEDFEAHFAKVSQDDPRFERISEKDLQEHGLGKSTLGKIKYSFANLLMLHRPLIIMDEAHNARTKLTFDVLKRVHPSCIIEFSATPDISQTSASNVLYHCTAAELKDEDMIKLPIMLTQHNDWQSAVLAAVLTGKKLNEEARKEPEYVRPIVLFQAEAKNGEVTVDVLKNYLINDIKISETEIAIATGNQRELDGIDLFSENCPIKYIITMEALKEGWDCSFAYIFCSVKDVRSSKDAEQLLGRVLRLPYAKTRQVPALNRAYAHLASPAFVDVANDLCDKLVNMGFEAMEAMTAVQSHSPQTDLFNNQPAEPVEKTLVIELKEYPDLPESNAYKITETENQGYKIEITGEVSEDLSKQLLKTVSGTEKKQLTTKIEFHNKTIEINKAPSMRGEVFASLPQLCWQQNDLLELLEPKNFLQLSGQWNLQDYPFELPQFSLKDTAKNFEVDIDGNKVVYKNAGQSDVINLDWVKTDITENDLVRWLDSKVRQQDIKQSSLLLFLKQLVHHLIQARNIPLTGLVRHKFELARIITQQIAIYRESAAKKGFQLSLLDNTDTLKTSFEFSYPFDKDNYPARPPYYQGTRYKFTKHYYPIIEDLKSSGEEFECAKAIDSMTEVKHWIRNLVQRERASFRLPLAKYYFYPDFIVELQDGRLLVIEYKGEVYRTNDDSREKQLVGECWAKQSNGKCLFLMATLKDEKGRDVSQQIEAVIKQNVF